MWNNRTGAKNEGNNNRKRAAERKISALNLLLCGSRCGATKKGQKLRSGWRKIPVAANAKETNRKWHADDVIMGTRLRPVYNTLHRRCRRKDCRWEVMR